MGLDKKYMLMAKDTMVFIKKLGTIYEVNVANTQTGDIVIISVPTDKKEEFINMLSDLFNDPIE